VSAFRLFLFGRGRSSAGDGGGSVGRSASSSSGGVRGGASSGVNRSASSFGRSAGSGVNRSASSFGGGFDSGASGGCSFGSGVSGLFLGAGGQGERGGGRGGEKFERHEYPSKDDCATQGTGTPDLAATA
jgi:hypothetical protein